MTDAATRTPFQAWRAAVRPAVHRRLARRLAAAAAFRGGAVGLHRRLNPGPLDATAVLAYHAVADDPLYASPEITVPPALFRRQVAYLAARYTVLPLDEALARFAENAPLPPRSVVITFDDGYRDNLDHAVPILREHGLSATFFVTAGPVLEGACFWVGWLEAILRDPRGQATVRAYFDLERTPLEALFDAVSAVVNRLPVAVREERFDQLARRLTAAGVATLASASFMLDRTGCRALVAAGMAVGSHTVSHPILTCLAPAERIPELARSRAMLEDALDRPVRHIAYPNGRGITTNVDASVATAARQVGYVSGHSSIRGLARAGDDPLLLHRIGVSAHGGLAGFALRLERYRAAAVAAGPSPLERAT